MSITELIGEATDYDKKIALEKKKPKSWCKSVSAFANGRGGKLIFGVADDDTIVGLANAEEDANIISEQIKERLDPIPNTSLSFYKSEDKKKLLILEVFPGEETPYYYVADGSLMAYHRLGNQSVPANSDKLRELVLRGSGRSYDSLKSKHNFENLAFTKLRAVYKQRTGLDFSDSDYESFGLIDGEANLTNAGALLADESPIRHSRVFCTRWNGLTMASGVIDAIDDKEYSGGLINLLQDSVNFVTNNSKKMWKKEKDRRVEMPDYPERAVLEGIVNALIHRNYLELGSEVHIDMYDDRLEIYSPGGMYDGIDIKDRDIRDVPSRRRNPVIADIFNRLNFMERRGSGFKKILEDYENHPNYREALAPTFNSEHDAFVLTLRNMNYVEVDYKISVAQGVAQGVVQGVAQDNSDIEDAIIELIKNNNKISREQMAKEIGVSVKTIERRLKGMEQIRFIGSGYSGYWEIGDNLEN